MQTFIPANLAYVVKFDALLNFAKNESPIFISRIVSATPEFFRAAGMGMSD
jgi:hypothetical protein